MADYRMAERLTPYLRQLIAKGNTAIEMQYRQDVPMSQEPELFPELDPLGEDSRYSKGSGIVHKFGNRVLWKATFRCAAHCQFCTRYRQIGTPKGDLSKLDIETGLAYIAANPEIDDVILSGGDPLYVPQITSQIVLGLSKIDSVRVVRIGTRLPIHSPRTFQSVPIKKLLSLFSEIAKHKAMYALIQFNHPDELTKEVDVVLRELVQAGMVLLSQTVFLKGVNDSKDILAKLFCELFYRGVVPYYIYRCDYVHGLERFVCELNVERKIMTELTKTLSGIAVPTYVIDVAGRGKIPVPLEFWKPTALVSCVDFDGKKMLV
jgi:lysine 2,3-aminomutase